MGDAREGGILVEEPVANLADQLGIDYRGLFADLGKATVSGLIGFSTGNPGAIGGAMKNVISTYTRFGDPKTLHEVQDEPGTLAWLLIHESLLDAMRRLILDHGARFRDAYSGKELPDQDDTRERLHNELTIRLADEDLRITAAFFDHPAQLEVLGTAKQDLKEWFTALGVERGEANAVADHLPGYFRRSLIDIWRLHLDAFQLLEDHLTIPFSHHEKTAAAWERYRAILQEEVDKPVFGEAVSLRQVYIWPRAYTLPDEDSDQLAGQEALPEAQVVMSEHLTHRDKRPRRVVQLKTAVLDWLDGTDPDDAIRIISADPGIGKSSFCRMLADELATSKQMPVLYVPLHNLDTSKGLREAVHAYLHDAKLFPRDVYPLDGDALLLILDGLDELSMQGAVGAREAEMFLREVKDKVLNLNQHTFRIRVLVSGRKIASAAARDVLKRPPSVFYMIPFVPEGNPDEYVDPDGLLNADQRNEWWKKYGEITGQSGLTELPEDLDTEQLADITAQPLLNYLVALAYGDDASQFDEDARLNTVYARLLDGVYRRDYDFGPHPGAEVLVGASRKEQKRGFLRVLEEIALDAWHGDGRTTTIPSIEQRCKDASLERHFQVVREKLEEGITQLLAAFYFRRSGETPKGVETFEFTHKTFAEYLTARRIVRAIDDIHDRYEQHKHGGRYPLNLKDCIVEWIEICGPSDIDEDLYRFIQDEISLLVETWERNGQETGNDVARDVAMSERGVDAEAWQETFADMLRHTIPHDVPMQKIDRDLSFQQQKNWAVNTEQSILAMLDACQTALRRRDRQFRDLEPGDRFSQYVVRVFDGITRGATLRWVRGLTALEPKPRHLSAISWTGRMLSTVVLPFTDLRGADLRGATLLTANLRSADLRSADLRGANLRSADLWSADLQHADLRSADLQHANLRGADLQHADLQYVNLRDANLRGTDLQHADLQHADLQHADLRHANLQDADLPVADLRDADLRSADLRVVVLHGAGLENAVFDAQTTLDDGMHEDLIARGAIFADG